MENMLDRKIKPSAAGEVKFNLPPIERFELTNGLKVLFVKKDNLPILNINLVVDAGNKFDPADKKGLSNLFARVIDEGAGNFNALELSDEFDLLGTNFGVNCFSDNIHFSLQTLNENLERSLELFSLVLTKPQFSQEAFERERRKILITIQQLKDSPEDIADLAFDYLVFGNSNPYAYPTIGYAPHIEKIKVKDLRDFYINSFSPVNSNLIVVGNIELEELKLHLNNYISLWNNKASVNDIKLIQQDGNASINFIHKEGAVQSEIRIGHITEKRSEENFFAKLLLNTILGGQFSSRINLNLREDKGYTYGASSRFNYLKESGFFYVSTSVGAENTANAINEIIKELELIKQGVTKKELDFAKDSISRRFPGNFETYSQVASNMISLINHSLPYNYFDNYISEINNKTISDINKAAIDFIKPEKLKILVVGDKNLLRNQIENLNRGNIVELDINGIPI